MALSRISKLAGDYAGDLALPLSTIASGGSKAVATMQLLGGILVTKVLGPLGAVAGIVYGITSSFVNWAKAVDLVGQAMDRAAAKQAMVKQLAEITKSTAIAKSKLQDLLSYAQRAPFSLTGILEGGRALAKVSSGALLTKANLKLVGDSAAASGQQFTTVAEAVSSFYSDLKSGQPIQESANALRDMGLFSQATVDKLEDLQKTGAGIATTFSAATDALKANSGAMEGVLQTIEDLQEKQGQVKAGILTPAGQIFTDSQKKGIEAQTQLLEKLAPVLTVIFRIVARVSDVLGFFQRRIISLIAAIPGLSTIVGGAVTAFTLLAAATAAISTAKFITFLANSIISLRKYTAAAGGAVMATQALQAANAGRITTGISQISQLNTERTYGVIGGLEGPQMSGRMMAGEAASGVKNIAIGLSARAAAGGLAILRSGISYIGEGLSGLVTGLGGVASGITAVAVLASIAYDKFTAATDAINEMSDATNKNAEAFNKQLANIRTASDAAAVYGQAMDSAAAARSQLNDVQNQRAGSGYGGLFGLSDWLNQQDTKELAAKNAVGFAEQYAKIAKRMQNAPTNALPDDINRQIVDAQISHMEAVRSIAFAESTPEQALKAKEQLATNAEKEFAAKFATQQALLGKSRIGDQNYIKLNSGSEEMRIQGLLDMTPNTPENALTRQKLQNQIEITRARNANPGQKRSEADEAKAAYEFQDKKDKVEQANLDTQKEAASMDVVAVSAARDKLGILKEQIALIEQNNDLTRTQKDNAIEQLKITQLQAAAEVYRNQVARAAEVTRLRAEAAGSAGNAAGAIALNAAADKLEDDAKEAQRRQEYYKQNISAGQTRDEAKSNATDSAAIDRLVDIRRRAMEKVRNLPMPNVGSGGQGTPWSPALASFLSPEELASLPNRGQSDSNSLFGRNIKTPLPGFAGGGLDAVTLPTSMLGVDALNPGRGNSPFPSSFTGVMQSDPLLSVNQAQLEVLKEIRDGKTKSSPSEGTY